MDDLGVAQSKQGTQTATRSLRILWLLARSTEPMTLREIVDALGITRSAAHRLLGEFARQELVVRTADNRYAVGPALVALAAKVLPNEPLLATLRPVLEGICKQTLETVTLHIRSGDQRVSVDTIESPHPIRRVIPLGQSLPLYQGPTGKVILAYLPPERRESVLSAAAAAGKDRSRIEQQLDLVTDQGFLATVSDRIQGVGGLSFAVVRDGDPVGAVTVSGPADRWTVAAMEAVVPNIREECAALRSWTTSLTLSTRSNTTSLEMGRE